MDGTRKRIVLSAVIVFAVGLSPILTACSGSPPSTVDQGAGNSTEAGGTGETENAADIQETALPDGFPKEVPLAKGAVLSSGGMDKTTGHVWNVSIQVSDKNAMDGISAQMKDAGFTSKVSSDSGSENTAGSFDKVPYDVLVVVYKDQSGGFTASYTVTYKKP